MVNIVPANIDEDSELYELYDEEQFSRIGDLYIDNESGKLYDNEGHELPSDTVVNEEGQVVSDTFKDVLVPNKDKLKRADSILTRKQSSILSILSSITASQTKILNYIFTSQMMYIESKARSSTNATDFYNAVWLVVNMNMFLNPKYNTQMNNYVNNLTKAATTGLTWTTGKGLTSEQSKQIIQLTVDNGMKYINNLGTDISKQMADILSNGIKNGEPTTVMVGQITEILNGQAGRAKSIARTETQRASIAVGYTDAQLQGMTFWVVDNRAEACEICVDEYEGEVFRMDEIDALPPLHPNCACVPIYYNNFKDASLMTDEIAADKQELRNEIISDTGKPIPKDGTGNITND